MSTFKIVLAYDGTDYIGWQRQATGVSIQGLLEGALRALDDRDVAVAGAGRTDAGVHALGQVASFSLQRQIDAATVARALNARLPPDVRVWSSVAVRDGFHARFNARSKTYRYRIWNGEVLSPFERRYAWQVTSPLDVDAMAAAAATLEGRHDFAAFRSAGCEARDSVRTIFASHVQKSVTTVDTEVTQRTPFLDQESGALRVNHRDPRSSALVTYEITADGFLRHMVRAIVGSLVEIGRGRDDAAWIGEVLASRDRTKAGRTAPAAGLFLASVDYGPLVADES